MRRTLTAVAVIAMLAGAAYWAVAAETPAAKDGMMGKMPMRGGMMGMEMKEHMGGMCPGHMMMGKMMANSQMVAMPDGDVVVLMGTTLTKYDKNLVVMKEVELKVDTDAMMKKMTEMCEKCPMCKAMKERETKEMEPSKMKEEMKEMKDMKTETK
jgi:hypothetical protein